MDEWVLSWFLFNHMLLLWGNMLFSRYSVCNYYVKWIQIFFVTNTNCHNYLEFFFRHICYLLVIFSIKNAIERQPKWRLRGNQRLLLLHEYQRQDSPQQPPRVSDVPPQLTPPSSSFGPCTMEINLTTETKYHWERRNFGTTIVHWFHELRFNLN